MVKVIKDVSKLGVAILKIALFFLPIIALISGMMGVVGMMMNMDDPAIMPGQPSQPDSNNEMTMPVNYSISNPTNFAWRDYTLMMGMEIDTADGPINVWSSPLNVGDIAPGESAEGTNAELTIALPDSIDFSVDTYNVTMKMSISFKTAIGLADFNLEAAMMTNEMGPDADSNGGGD